MLTLAKHFQFQADNSLATKQLNKTKKGSPWFFAITKMVPTSAPSRSLENTKILVASKTLTLAAWAALIEAMQRLG